MQMTGRLAGRQWRLANRNATAIRSRAEPSTISVPNRNRRSRRRRTPSPPEASLPQSRVRPGARVGRKRRRVERGLSDCVLLAVEQILKLDQRVDLMVGSDIGTIWFPVPIQPNRHRACPSRPFHIGGQRISDMHQLLWSAAGLTARLLKNRRIRFFDTNILSQDHKGEAAVQPASLRVAVPV